MGDDAATPKTTYHVLRFLDHQADAVTDDFALVGLDISAHSAEHAIRIYAERAGDKAEGKYVAVASSRWKLQTITVATKTVVTLGTP